MSYVQNIAQTDSDELTKHFLILCLSFFDQKMTLNEPSKFALAIAENRPKPWGGVHAENRPKQAKISGNEFAGVGAK